MDGQKRDKGEAGDELTRRSEEICEGLARAMAEARQSRHVSKSSMAKKLGTTRETIRKYENNETKIPVYAVSRYSTVLEIPLEQLLAGVPSYKEVSTEMEALSNYRERLAKRSREAQKCIAWINRNLPAMPDRMLKAIRDGMSGYAAAPKKTDEK